MATFYKLQDNQDSILSQQKIEVEFAEVPIFEASPFQPASESGTELTTRQLPVCVRLDLEDLQNFEVIDRQFQDWGVTFDNAVALNPSNPAYPARSGSMVMLGAPKSGWLQATFLRPVRYISGYVTSSRSAVLAAFDSNNRLVAQTKIPRANLAGSKSEVLPNRKLCLCGANIHRVTFSAFDGQLTVDDFSFSF